MNALLAISLMLVAQQAAAPEAAVTAVLDDWHQAAAVADEKRYFSHFTGDGVFMGTDATERWNRDQFRVWAKPHFSKGKAWKFRAVKRHVQLASDGNTAWFDEELATENMGPCRGSGVLVKQNGTWRIAHYNLSIPIPNDAFKDVKKILDQHVAKSPK